MRIAVGGIMHESNTFSPQSTDVARFREGSLTYGAAMVPAWRDAHHEVGGFIEGASKFGFDAVPLGMAWATPSGPVTDEFLDHFCDTLATGLRMARPDGVLIALHGAMVTPSHLSADTEVLRRLREAVGPDVPVAATLDFHGNVSPAMAEYANILVGYQTYPHIDQRERGLLAAQLLTRMARGEVRAVTRISKPPMILSLLGQETAREPMRSLMAGAREVERRPGVLSVSLMAGFPYGDVPEMGPAVIAVTDDDTEQAKATAKELGDAMWEVRKELYVPCPEPREAVAQAIASQRTPVLLVDLGDNVGGGSAGDGTVLLAELLSQQATGFVVVLFAPKAVAAAQAASLGGKFEAAVGGAGDLLHGDLVHICGVVKSLQDGRWVESEARHGGRRENDQGPTAVIDLGNANTLVLNSLRTPPFSLGQLTSLGIDPAAARIIVVKAAVAYKAAYEPIAGEIIPVDTPGLTAINPARFNYTRIRRPMYPLDS
jgi:microcystin degradation protein MlrC